MFEFFSFFIILLAAVFFSALFNRLHLPFVVALIIGGIVIGPFGFGFLEITPTIDFLGQIGLVFLMFIAGMEVKFSNIAKDKKNIVIISIINGLIPFIVGALIAIIFGYANLGVILLGLIFISSSVAVIIPSIEHSGLIKTRLGKEIISVTIVHDIISLIFLALVLQTINPNPDLPLALFLVLLVLIGLGLRVVLPKIRKAIDALREDKKTLFDFEFRLIFMLLFGVVVIFEVLGLHPIIAGFFTGLILAGSIKSPILKQKIHAISYGIFIPIFFIIVGAKTDIALLFHLNTALFLALAIVIGSLLAKIVSGYIAGKAVNFNNLESLLLGVSTTPQLSTALAVVFVGNELGILDNNMLTAMVLLSIITTLAGPLLINLLAQQIKG